MNDQNKTDDSELVMYIVVREEIAMSTGKTSAQVGHAVQYALMDRYESSVPKNIAEPWMNSGSTKIVLRASDSEFERAKRETQHALVVRDAGRTELEPETETALAVWPTKKSERPTILKRLRLL